MFTLILQLWRKNSRFKNVLFIIALSVLSLYPIYRNYYYGRAIEQYERHVQFMAVNTQFHNPWQYRIFTPLTVEGLKYLYDNTIDKIFPAEKFIVNKIPENSKPKESMKELISQLKNPDFIKYNIVYAAYRFVLNVLIYLLTFTLLAHFVSSRWLIYFGLIFLSLSLGNAVNDSDLTLHTYLDTVLYLFAALIILSKRNDWYIVPLVIIGATNRETCLLIPFLYLVSSVDWHGWASQKFSPRKFPFPKSKTIAVTAVSAVFFVAIFLAIRWYYGYQPQTEWKVPAGLPMLKLNLLSALGIKSYFEMIGLFSIIPIICLLKLRRASIVLQVWFIGIVPIWFLVHWVSVVAYQARLFLVPTVIVFIPMLLEFVEKDVLKKEEK